MTQDDNSRGSLEQMGSIDQGLTLRTVSSLCFTVITELYMAFSVQYQSITLRMASRESEDPKLAGCLSLASLETVTLKEKEKLRLNV